MLMIEETIIDPITHDPLKNRELIGGIVKVNGFGYNIDTFLTLIKNTDAQSDIDFKLANKSEWVMSMLKLNEKAGTFDADTETGECLLYKPLKDPLANIIFTEKELESIYEQLYIYVREHPTTRYTSNYLLNKSHPMCKKSSGGKKKKTLKKRKYIKKRGTKRKYKVSKKTLRKYKVSKKTLRK